MKNEKLRKILKAGLCLSAAMSIAFGMTACGSSSGSDSGSDTIRVGVLTDLTGSLADYGIGVTSGYKLAADEINSSGGINGKQIEFVTYDCKGDNNVYQEMARKVCLEDNVDVVLFRVDENNVMNPIKTFTGIRSNYISGTKGVNLAELGKGAPNTQFEPIND